MRSTCSLALLPFLCLLAAPAAGCKVAACDNYPQVCAPQVTSISPMSLYQGTSGSLIADVQNVVVASPLSAILTQTDDMVHPVQPDRLILRESSGTPLANEPASLANYLSNSNGVIKAEVLFTPNDLVQFTVGTDIKLYIRNVFGAGLGTIHFIQ